MKIHVFPTFSGEDKGDGGVRRVVEAQLRSLPRLRVQFTSAGDADLIASHIMIPDEYLRLFPDKPFVSHCHGLYWAEYEWETWAYKANKGVLKSICTADAVTAPTEWVAQTIRRHTSRKVYVVPHGVSGREWQPGENRGYVLWNKTRVDSVCSPDDLNVLARVMPDIPFVSTFGDERANMTLTGRL
ncbi:MAG TPA: glycosyltransferase, partial [Geobacteraceae bacterium]